MRSKFDFKTLFETIFFYVLDAQSVQLRLRRGYLVVCPIIYSCVEKKIKFDFKKILTPLYREIRNLSSSHLATTIQWLIQQIVKQCSACNLGVDYPKKNSILKSQFYSLISKTPWEMEIVSMYVGLDFTKHLIIKYLMIWPKRDH